MEMVCADFLAGANLDHRDPKMLLYSMTRFFKFLPAEQPQAFLDGLTELMSSIGPKLAALRWIRHHTRIYLSRCCVETAGGVNHAARCRTWRFTIRNFAATRAKIPN